MERPSRAASRVRRRALPAHSAAALRAVATSRDSSPSGFVALGNPRIWNLVSDTRVLSPTAVKSKLMPDRRNSASTHAAGARGVRQQGLRNLARVVDFTPAHGAGAPSSG